MKILLILPFVLVVIIGCNERKTEEQIVYDSAEIIYLDNYEWGSNRMIHLITSEVIECFREYKGNSGLKSFYFDNPDTLSYIRKSIESSQRDSLVNGQECNDAIIVALLHYGDKTDTLATDAWTHTPLQFNRNEFKDSSLVMHLIDAICARDTQWKASKEVYFWDGVFHAFPKEFYKGWYIE